MHKHIFAAALLLVASSVQAAALGSQEWLDALPVYGQVLVLASPCALVIALSIWIARAVERIRIRRLIAKFEAFEAHEHRRARRPANPQQKGSYFVLLAALLATPAAKADTCDIVAGGLIRSYEGVTLGADQLGAVGTLQFSGDVLTIYPSPRTFSSARTQPAGDWDVAVSFGGDLIVAEHCKVAYLTMLAGQTHWRLTCPAVARVSATHIGGAK